jgi:hypothetical protein
LDDGDKAKGIKIIDLGGHFWFVVSPLTRCPGAFAILFSVWQGQVRCPDSMKI